MNQKMFSLVAGFVLIASLSACTTQPTSVSPEAMQSPADAMGGDAMNEGDAMQSPGDAMNKGDAMGGNAMNKGDAMQSPGDTMQQPPAK